MHWFGYDWDLCSFYWWECFCICLDVRVTVSCALDLCIRNPLKWAITLRITSDTTPSDPFWPVSMMGNYFSLMCLMCCHVTWRYTQLEIQHKLNSNNPIKWGWDKIVQLNIQYVNNVQIHIFFLWFKSVCNVTVFYRHIVCLSASHVT